MEGCWKPTHPLKGLVHRLTHSEAGPLQRDSSSKGAKDIQERLRWGLPLWPWWLPSRSLQGQAGRHQIWICITQVNTACPALVTPWDSAPPNTALGPFSNCASWAASACAARFLKNSPKSAGPKQTAAGLSMPLCLSLNGPRPSVVGSWPQVTVRRLLHASWSSTESCNWGLLCSSYQGVLHGAQAVADLSLCAFPKRPQNQHTWHVASSHNRATPN